MMAIAARIPNIEFYETAIARVRLSRVCVEAFVRLSDELLARADELDYSSLLAGHIEHGAQVRIPPLSQPIACTEERALLFDLLLDHAKRYLACIDELAYSTPFVELDDAWIVSQLAGDFNPRHAHDGLVSGVLYLKVPPQIDETSAPAGYFSFLHTDPTEEIPNDRGSVSERRAFTVGPPDIAPWDPERERHLVKPVAGDLYLFPSWLMHEVESFEGDGERRSLSFNVCRARPADSDFEVLRLFGPRRLP